MVKVNFRTKNQGHMSTNPAVRVLTHRRKEGSDSITSTADAGGKKPLGIFTEQTVTCRQTCVELMRRIFFIMNKK